jgi:hypothetical protein
MKRTACKELLYPGGGWPLLATLFAATARKNVTSMMIIEV